jgi:hypothetical protein
VGQAVGLDLSAIGHALLNPLVAVDVVLGPLGSLRLHALDTVRADALGAAVLHGHALHMRQLHTLGLALHAHCLALDARSSLTLHPLRLGALDAFSPLLRASTMATGACGSRRGNRHRGHARGQI